MNEGIGFQDSLFGKFPDNIPLFFGTMDDASIFYDGTNLVINPAAVGTGFVDLSGGNLKANHIGLGGSNPSATNMLFTSVSSTDRGIIQGTITYTGTISVAGMVFIVNWNSASTPNGVGASGRAFQQANFSTGTGGLIGLDGRTGFQSASTVVSGGTLDLTAFTVQWNGNGGTHTGGTVNRRMIWQQNVNALTGLTDNLWGGLFNNDVQLNSGAKLILEGTDTTKGDSYLDFASAKIRITVNGTLVASASATLWDALGYSVGGAAGASGTFTTTDLKTVTVTNGLVTSIV